jgi:hypothetical protein
MWVTRARTVSKDPWRTDFRVKIALEVGRLVILGPAAPVPVPVNDEPGESVLFDEGAGFDVGEKQRLDLLAERRVIGARGIEELRSQIGTLLEDRGKRLFHPTPAVGIHSSKPVNRNHALDCVNLARASALCSCREIRELLLSW